MALSSFPFYSAAAFSGAALVIFEVFLVKIIRYSLGSSYSAYTLTLAALSAGMLAGSALGSLYTKRKRVTAGTLILFFAASYALVFFSPELISLSGSAAPLINSVILSRAAAFIMLFLFFTSSCFLLPLTAEAGADKAPAMKLYLVYTGGGLLAALFSETVLPYLISDAALIIKTTCAFAFTASLLPFIAIAGKESGGSVEAAAGKIKHQLNYKYLFTAMAAGTISISAEAIAIRIFSAVYINGNFIFSAVLFSYIAGLSAGYAASEAYSGKSGVKIKISLLFLLMSAAAITEIFLIRFFLRGTGYQETFLARSFYFSEGLSSSFFHIITIVFTAVFPQAFFSGLLLPLLYKNDTGSGGGHKIGAYSAAGTAGNLLSLALVTYLIGAAGYAKTIRSFALAALWVSFFTFASHLRYRGYLKYLPAPALLSFLIIYSSSGGYFLGDYDLTPDYRIFWRSEGKESLIEVIGTRSGELYLMSDRIDEGGYIPGVQVNPGLEILLPLMMTEKPESIFITGLGTGMNLEPLTRLPGLKAVCAELCPEIISAARSYFMSRELSSCPNLSILNEDGWTVLKRRGEKYDLIVTTLIHPYKSGAVSVNSREYFTACRERLSLGGRYVHFLALNEYSPKHLALLLATLKSVFPEVELFNVSRKFIMAACGREKVSFEVIRRRYSELSATVGLENYGINSPEDALSKYYFSCPSIEAGVLTFNSLDFDYELNREIFFRFGTNNDDNTARNRHFIEKLADKTR